MRSHSSCLFYLLFTPMDMIPDTFMNKIDERTDDGGPTDDADGLPGFVGH